jgi:HD-GYP domain-containing protein (c-di-GMP phosphodiesterase class II)
VATRAARLSAAPKDVRLAELLGALSLAADAGAGQPPERTLRACALACRLADAAGLEPEERRDVFYVSLLRSIGCTSDAHEQALLFGDEIAARAELNLAAHLTPRELFAALARHASSKRVLVSARGLPHAIAAAHCDAAERLAARLGIADSARRGLLAVFERWDGRGFPRGLSREQIPLPVRFAQVAYDAALLHGVRGADGAAAAIRRARGKLFDPAVVDVLFSVELQPEGEPWDAVLAADPDRIVLDDTALDDACRAVGEFADLKSPWFLGHSAAVAELAEAAAWRLELDAPTVRRAGHLHDLGRVAVSSSVWDRPGPLGAADWDGVRLHTYHVERYLSRSPALAEIGVVAAAHHERLDGSGYHRGVSAAQLPPAARVLAAADAFQALTEARPHRAALPPAGAAEELRAEVRIGRLDADAAAAVLEAAGQRGAQTYRELPAGLTAREAQALTLLARGLTNKQIAARLEIAPKTVGRHLEHAYAKARVSTRAAAALFAMERGLLDMGHSPDLHARPRALASGRHRQGGSP